MSTSVILLACGSFNPPTYMHLRMFEIARDHLHRLGQHVVGGIISPVHDTYGKKDLHSNKHRLDMVKLAIQNSDWIKLSDWECRQESWSRTRQVLQYHQNLVNSVLHSKTNCFDINENDIKWIPDNIKSGSGNPVIVKLLCGADLLESFGTPGLWSDEDIEAIVGHHGLVVISRAQSNPAEFIYNSDILTKYMANITIVTEWIRNEISSTKIRRALRRSESVQYLMPENVINYIYKHALYAAVKTKYMTCEIPYNSTLLTPSPSDVNMDSPSPVNCLYICNNNPFMRSSQYEKPTSNDGGHKHTIVSFKHPGQAVKIVTESIGEHKVNHGNKESSKEEVCNQKDKKLKGSKSYTDFADIESKHVNHSKSNYNLKECKSCDENLIKFIFTKHGIEVISDVETIV